MNKPQFYLNLPTKRRTVSQNCRQCKKDYETQYRQQRYCNDPCTPPTGKGVKGPYIFNCKKCGNEFTAKRYHQKYCQNPCTRFYVKRSGNNKHERQKCESESLGSTSRKWLSMKL